MSASARGTCVADSPPCLRTPVPPTDGVQWPPKTVLFDKDEFLDRVRIMSKVTSKLQVTIPKRLAEQYGIRPGDQIQWEPMGDYIRLVPPAARGSPRLDVATRLELFRQSTERIRKLTAHIPPAPPGTPRGWTREDLYSDRGRPR